MSKRGGTAGADDSSLELLLDTICNTFGGVLFISILVVLLVNMSSEAVSTSAPDSITQSELIEMQSQLQQSQERLEKLRRVIELQKDIEQSFVDPAAKDLVREWRKSNEQVSLAVESKNQTLENISQSQEQINEIATELAENKQALERVQQELSDVERQLRAETTARSQSASLPKVRRSVKRQMVFFLREGRLTAYAKRGAGGEYAPNTAEIVEASDERGAYIEPKPNAGALINPDESDQPAIARILADFDPRQHYVAIFVWPDSFPQFAAVKGFMVRKQFEYQLVPVPNREKVRFGAGSGAGEVQ